MPAPSAQVTSGINGSVTFAGDSTLVAFVSKWSLNLKYDTFKGTVFGQAYKTVAAGAYEWSGKCEGYISQAGALTGTAPPSLPAASTSSPGIAGTVHLIYANVTTDGEFNGSVVVSNVEWGVPTDGLQTLSFDFEGTGALVHVVPVA